MEQNNAIQNEEQEIDLLELFHALRRKWYMLLAALLVFALAAGVGTKLLITPQYQSSAMIYILTKTTSVTSLADLQIGSQLTIDFETLAMSRPVVNKVRENLGLEEISYEEFRGLLTVSNPADTRILQITATHPDPETAQEVANAMAEATADRVAEIMVTDRPTIVEEAVVAENPSSPNLLKNVLLGGMIGLFLAAALIIVRHLMDDTIKTEEDVEKYLQLNTIAAFSYNKKTSGGETGKKRRKSA